MPPTDPPLLAQAKPSNKDILQVDVMGRMRGQDIQNTYYVISHTPEDETPGNEPDLSHLATQIQGIWRTFFLPAVSTAYSVSKYRARNIVGRVLTQPGSYRDVYGTTFELQGNAGDVGAAPGSPMPTFTSCSVTCRTALTGKRWTGSRRMPPVLESQVEDDVLLQATIDLLGPIYTQIWVVEVSLNAGGNIGSSSHYSRSYADAQQSGDPWTWCLPYLTATLQPVYSHQTSRRLKFVEAPVAAGDGGDPDPDE